MALWSRQKKVDIPAELQPYYAGDSTGGNRSWLLWLARILGLIVIIILIALFVRWTWHESHTGGKKAGAPGTSQQQKPAKPKSGSSNSPQSNSSTSNGLPSESSSPSSTNPNNGSSSADQSLTNTGPGETIAVFFATSAVGVVLYQYRLRRKTQQR